MKISRFKHNKSKANIKILEQMNEISISRESYLEIVRKQFNLYFTSYFPLSKDYMESRRSDWEEDKEFTADQVR